MARKAKELRKNTVTTATTRKSPWDDDMPQKLRNLVTRKPIESNGINPGGLAKSWEFFPKNCNNIEKFSSLPQLRHITTDLESYKHPAYFSWYRRATNDFPFWEKNTIFNHIVFFNDPNNFIAVGVTGVARPLFMFYKQTCPWYVCYRVRRGFSETRHEPNDHKWVDYDRALIDPNSSNQRYMQLVNIVGFNGKFYALSLQGTLVIIEEINSLMVISGISSSRAVPSVYSRHFREYLIESDGEIWLIFLISMKSASVVDNVEIFRLQVENISWKKVERLGKNKAVFVSLKNCLVVMANEVGCKDNCVYFSNYGVDGWWVYDVATGDISPCSSSDDSSEIFI